MRSPLIIVLAALLLSMGGPAFGADAVNDISLLVTTAPAPPSGVDIAIRLRTLGKKNFFTPVIDVAGSQNASLFELAVVGRENDRIPVKVLPPQAMTSNSITLRPLTALKASEHYELRILRGGIEFNADELRANNAHVVPFENKWILLDPDRVTADTEFVNPYPATSASLIQGNTGAFSLSANYRHFFGPDRHGVIHANLDADISFLPPSKSNYIDAIQGEVGGYWVVKPANSIVELGFSTKTQADQQFRKIEQTIGVNGWFWLNCKLFDEIYRLPMMLTQPGQARLYAALPPTLVFGYDYVGHLRDETDGVEDGTNRLTGRFYWVIPILQNLQSKTPILSQLKGVDFVTDLSAIYDIDKGKFAPEVKLAVDFSLANSKSQPILTLSYVNGQSAPRFENFNAVLAGFKMKF